MRKKTAEQLRKIHTEALVEFDSIQMASRPERMQCLEDRRFALIAGAQWEGDLGEQFANKPRFEFNKTQQAWLRIINEYRQNRITVDFQPRDGSTDDELADTCDGLFRADERSSAANEAYDNAFGEGTAGGMGAWRLRACYENEEDDEDERQRVKMERINDADSCVFFNLAANRDDKADAKRAWVLTPYPREAYKEEWKDDPASWPKPIQQAYFDWCTPDMVWVAEFYRIEDKDEKVYYFQPLDPEAKEIRYTEDELEGGVRDELLATGHIQTREKTVKRPRVHKYLMSGGSILEDCGIVPGRYIPVIPYFAKRNVIDGVERISGHVRLAKDAQRLINLLLSWLAEMSSRFDMEKPYFTPEQIAGHAQMWADDAIQKYPYLLINPITDPATGQSMVAPVAYSRAPQIPPAMAALAEIANTALSDLLGNQQAGEEIQPQISGKAVELIQNRLDMQVAIYTDQFAKKAMQHSGVVWLSMMRDIVVEKSRRMKTIGTSGDVGSVLVNNPAYDPETGREYVENDLSKATFEVVADVGPSSSSARAAAVRALTGMMQLTQDPQDLSVLSGMAMMNMEGEGISDARDYYRNKLVRMGVVKPTEEEKAQLAQEQANAQPDPQAQFLLAEAERAQAEAAEKRASTVQKVADANLKQAQTTKTEAETAATYAKAVTEEQNRWIASSEHLQNLLNPPSQLQ